MGDTNFKERDPKKQYSDADDPKDRSGNYEGGTDFDPTDGVRPEPDEVDEAEERAEERSGERRRTEER